MMKTYGQVCLIAMDWGANTVLFIFNDHGTRLNEHLLRYFHLHSQVSDGLLVTILNPSES
jgi:hypothetical protein